MGFESIGHADHQHARLLSLTLHLHAQPALLLLREEITGKPVAVVLPSRTL